MASRNKVIQDAGKGIETLRSMRQSIYLQNNTSRVVLGCEPAAIRIRRILIGSMIATSVTSIDVIALPITSALDTAVAAGNILMTQLTAIDTGKILAAQVLNANSVNVAADSAIVVVIIAGSAALTAPVLVQVEYDVIGHSYGTYDEGDQSGNTYPAGTVL